MEQINNIGVKPVKLNFKNINKVIPTIKFSTKFYNKRVHVYILNDDEVLIKTIRLLKNDESEGWELIRKFKEYGIYKMNTLITTTTLRFTSLCIHEYKSERNINVKEAKEQLKELNK